MADLTVLSLGAGVQSSTLLLMACEGAFGKVDAAIFADTQWEPSWVYEHLDYLEEPARAAGIPIYRATGGNLRADAMDPAKKFASMPLHIKNADGTNGMGRRQCTKEYKITVVRRRVREMLLERDLKQTRGAVDQLIGISFDELGRMRESGVRYVRNVYPLVDQRVRRRDCESWLNEHGYPIPRKSACIGCPYRSNRGWREIKADPVAWADAVEVDAAIRQGGLSVNALDGEAFLHKSRVPLPMVDLRTPEERGQSTMFDGDDEDAFDQECEGMCGL